MDGLVERLGTRSGSYPSLAARAYLNHAAISPPPTRVVQAVAEAMEDYSQLGVAAFGKWEQRREKLKSHFAQLIGAEADEIALGTNTSRGVSDLALSFPWFSGDRVLLFAGEFPANVTPWQRAAELFELELVFECAGDFLETAEHQQATGLQKLEARLKEGIALVAVSSVQFQSGLRMPLEEMGRLCRRYGTRLFVDGIQGCGVVPIDVRAAKVDFLSTGGHKWLLGMEGAGFLYVRKELAPLLRPYTAGWLSHLDPLSFLFQGAGRLRYDKPLRRSADVFEGGTGNLLGLAALGASIPLLLGLDPVQIYQHVQQYHDVLEPLLLDYGFTSLRGRPSSQRSGILAVLPPSDVDVIDLARALGAQGVVVGTPDGKLRFAPHFANSLEEPQWVGAAVEQALKELRS